MTGLYTVEQKPSKNGGRSYRYEMHRDGVPTPYFVYSSSDEPPKRLEDWARQLNRKRADGEPR